MKKIILIILVILIGATITMANDELKIKQRELKELQEQLSTVDSKIDNNKEEQYKIITQIDKVETEIRAVDTKINNLNNQISQLKNKIDFNEEELKLTKADLEDKRKKLQKRLRVMYKAGEVGYLEVLLGAKDFRDLLSRVEIVKRIVKHDKTLIKSIKADINEIEELQVKLKNDKQALEDNKNELKESKKYLAAKQGELLVQKKSLKENEKALKVLEDRLERDANKLTQIIKNFQSREEYVGGKMGWPAPSSYNITSPFGYRIHPIYKTKKLHTGIDIGSSWGSNIVAAQSGTVAYADWFGSYGKAVLIDHGGGYMTLYAHLSSINVSPGQKVARGAVIAKCGTTGNSTGPHLHFEVRVNGDYKNPVKYLKK